MPTCLIDDCPRPPRTPTADWCKMHYHRWYRHGDPLTRIEPPAPGTCKFDDCGLRATSLGWCKSHYDKNHHYGSPLGRTDIGYGGAHDRVRRQRGAARLQNCADCGGPAAHWSYDHSDSAPLIWSGLPYSPDPRRYAPKCVPCHKRSDNGRAIC